MRPFAVNAGTVRSWLASWFECLIFVRQTERTSQSCRHSKGGQTKRKQKNLTFFLQALAELKLGDEILYTEPQDREVPAEAYFTDLLASKHMYGEKSVCAVF